MSETNHPLRGLIERALIDYLPKSRLECADRLNDALLYAMFPGGKRMRPVLTLLAARLVNGDAQQALPAACAVEFLHASSLIFDDLPAMDDADVRRGNPAVHLVFGEDLALLAGIALLNQAYALFGRSPALVAEAAACIGVDGMIGGQAVDLAVRSEFGAAVPMSARNQKTAALLRLTLTAGALACHADSADVAALARAGECLGEAYQVCDDLLDQMLPCEQTGKTVRQDSRHHRPSHAAEGDAGACQSRVVELVSEARFALLNRFGHTEPVHALLDQIDGIVGEFSRAGLVTA